MQKELEDTVSKIIAILNEKYKIKDITYADIGDYISERCGIHIDPDIATKILEICHQKIREGGDLIEFPREEEKKLTKAFIGTIFKY